MRYRERGGVFVPHAKLRFLGREFVGPYWATWPLATMECRLEDLLIKSVLVNISIPIDAIDEVEVKASALRALTLNQHIVIRHHADAVSPVIFRAFRLSKLVAALKELGVSVRS